MFQTLPLIAETQFAAYLASGFTGTYQKITPTGTTTGTYSVINAFSIDPFTAPFIMVSALEFREINYPFSHVYRGNLNVEITTQIDDTTSDPIADHDQAVSQVYSLMSNQAAVYSGVEASNFHLYGYFITNYRQGIGEGHEMGRCVSTQLLYEIDCMNSGQG